MQKQNPLISVIIVNYNGKLVLPKCLASLEAQSFRNFEVIIIDNGSLDDSLGLIPYVRYPLRIIELGKNTGFAYANNRGIELAKGDWVALLNSDAFPESDWLENLVAATELYTDYSFFTSNQRCYNKPSYYDGTGDVYAINGRAYRRDYMASVKDTERHDGEVFGACAAAALYKKEILEEVGGFDEDYFCYFEDVDLSLRLRLMGYKCLYVENAKVFHVGAASSGSKDSDFAVYYGRRNLTWTFLKSMPMPYMLLFLPYHIVFNLIEIFYFIKQGQGRVILKAKWDAYKNLPSIIKRRIKVQQLKKISGFEVIGQMVWM